MSSVLKIDYPDSLPDALLESREQFENEAKMAMAVKLFEMKRISSGIAAKLAGKSRVEFLLDLHNYNIPMIDFPQEELESDMDAGTIPGTVQPLSRDPPSAAGKNARE